MLSAAPAATLVKDINTTPTSSTANPLGLVASNGLLYFTAADAFGGRELFRTDGTQAGTWRVKDINTAPINADPFNYNSDPGNLTDFKNQMFFTATSGEFGRELWKTNGTEAGTVMVKDISAGSESSNPGNLTVVGNTLYFTASNGPNGTELWKTDGTAAGTVMVKDILNGLNSSSIGNLVNFNGTLFFSATDGLNGVELWKSDGTAAGTVRVKDIREGAASSSPSQLTVAGNTLYFVANDGNSGQEIWKTNGTDAGTIRVSNIVAGSGTGLPQNLTAVNNTLFFTADDGSHGREVWKTDGTTASMVKDIVTGSTSSVPTDLYHYNGKLAFVANDGVNGREVWTSDGTSGGTSMLKNINPYPEGPAPTEFLNIGGTLFFAASNGPDGTELWSTDGTSGNTKMVKNIDVNSAASSNPRFLTNLNGTLYFFTSGTSFIEGLWKSDGSADGTTRAAIVRFDTSPSRPDSMIDNNGTLYFIAAGPNDTGRKLFKSDGTAAGTVLVKDIGLGPMNLGDAIPMTVANGKVFFGGKTPENGFELWVSDGTPGGTHMITDVRPGPDNGFFATDVPGRLITLGSRVIFIADDGVHENEVWSTNGTAAGTVRLTDMPMNMQLFDMGVYNGFVYFTYVNRVNGSQQREIWRTDGTAGGTSKVMNGNGFLYTALGNKLLFLTTTGDPTIYTLWAGNGTQQGTTALKDLKVDLTGSNRSRFTVAGNRLYFAAADGERPSVLWSSDGTVAGTKPVSAGSAGAFPIKLTAVGNTLYFVGLVESGKWAIWKSDGTEAGTKVVYNLGSNNVYNNDILLVEAGGALYFRDGLRIFRTDGTPGGTGYVADFWTIGASIQTSGYRIFVESGNALYFAGSMQYGGTELWKISPTAINATISGTVYADKNLSGTKDAGDTPQAGVQVYLDIDQNGSYDLHDYSVTTDASGNYAFHVPAGTYQVRQVPPPTYRRFRPTTQFHDVTVAANTTAADVDFGNTNNVLMSGTVFIDANSNASIQSWETRLANFRVYVDLNNNAAFDAGEPNRITNADGFYQFHGLTYGTGVLRMEMQPGYFRVSPGPGGYAGSLTIGQIVNNLNFGLQMLPASPAPAMIASGGSTTIDRDDAPSLAELLEI